MHALTTLHGSQDYGPSLPEPAPFETQPLRSCGCDGYSCEKMGNDLMSSPG